MGKEKNITAHIGSDFVSGSRFAEPDVPMRKSMASDTSIASDTMARDRLLTVIALLLGGIFFLGLPFALEAGAVFFLPLTGAFVVAVALVPLLEWLEKRGVPSALAAIVSLFAFAMAINAALAIVILPAMEWFGELPQSIPRIRRNFAPLIEFYSDFQRFFDKTLTSFASGTGETAQTIGATAPSSILDYFISAAPSVAIRTLFAFLMVFFFLAGWTRLRRQAIEGRSSFDGAMQTTRLIQNVVDTTANYLMTITVINMILGVLIASLMWFIDMPSPLMWGGIIVLFNFIPSLGSVFSTVLLSLGGLMAFDSLSLALLPAVIFIGIHFVEANLLTPLILGQRLTISPLLILLSLSFWSWIWGIAGALLAVPLLLIIRTIVATMELPDLLGFLLERRQ